MPTGVSMRCSPGAMRPRWAKRDSQADGAVAAHAEHADVVEEDHARGASGIGGFAEQGADQHVRAARLVDHADAEGIVLVAENASAIGQRNRDPRSGPPAMTTRVGSPPVCESMTEMRCMAAYR